MSGSSVTRAGAFEMLLGNVNKAHHARVLLELIRPNPFQPRRGLDDQEQRVLEHSLREHGQTTPIILRPTGLELGREHYEIIAGERRYHAAIMLGWLDIEASIRNATDQDMRYLALIENTVRQDLSAIDEVEYILDLMADMLELPRDTLPSLLYQQRRKPDPEMALRLEGFFQSVGVFNWHSFVANKLHLTRYPADVLQALRQRQINPRQAKALASVSDEGLRAMWLAELLSGELGAAELQLRVRTQSKTAMPSSSGLRGEDLEALRSGLSLKRIATLESAEQTRALALIDELLGLISRSR